MVRSQPQVTYIERTTCSQCGSTNLVTTKEPGNGVEGEKSCTEPDCHERYQTWDICIIPKGFSMMEGRKIGSGTKETICMICNQKFLARSTKICTACKQSGYKVKQMELVKQT